MAAHARVRPEIHDEAVQHAAALFEPGAYRIGVHYRGTDATHNWTGRFTRRGQSKTFTFKTPLDGVFATQLRGPHGSTLRLSGPAEIKRMSSTLSAGLVCGRRTVSERLVAGGAGRFSAAVAIP